MEKEEYFSFPKPEDGSPFPDSEIPENSPRFLAAKEQLRAEMSKKGGPNEEILTQMTHWWLAMRGAEADREKRNEERRNQA